MKDWTYSTHGSMINNIFNLNSFVSRPYRVVTFLPEGGLRANLLKVVNVNVRIFCIDVILNNS